MRWRIDSTERWAELLRFAVRAILAFNCFVLAIFSIWFTAMFLFRFGQFLTRTWLGHAW